MTTRANDVPEAAHNGDEPPVAPAPLAATRPLYWSVRRELWENRSIYLAPLVAAGVVLFGFLINTIRLPHRMRLLATLTPEQQHGVVVMPYSIVATLLILTTYIVAVFYCVDALYGERRDRSILFWKSLPVSDLTTVLAKACVPLVVLPAIAFTVSLAMQAVMLAWSTFLLGVTGAGVGELWARLPLVSMTFVMAYGITVHALWHAPIYAWLLLVSAWARRTPLLWAALPPLALGIFERIAFGTSYFGGFVKYRLIGAMSAAFAAQGEQDIDRFSQLDPLRFVTTPGLWIGLLGAAAFLAAATRLRRSREPL